MCKRLGSEYALFTNHISARHECGKKESQSIEDKKKQSTRFRDEVNIAWESIQKQPFLAKDRELSEFFMSLMGTVIFRKESAPVRMPSRIKDDSFLHALIEGGKTTIYKCKQSDSISQNYCLQVEEREIDFSSSNSWIGKVRNQLINMQEKVLSDVELSDDEKALLAESRLPLYKIVNVLTAYKRGTCPIDLYQVAEIVAMDLLMQFLNEAIEIVREGALQYKNEKMYGVDEINDFLEELKLVESKVRYYETRSMQLFEREFVLIQKIQLIEDQLRTELSFY